MNDVKRINKVVAQKHVLYLGKAIASKNWLKYTHFHKPLQNIYTHSFLKVKENWVQNRKFSQLMQKEVK